MAEGGRAYQRSARKGVGGMRLCKTCAKLERPACEACVDKAIAQAVSREREACAQAGAGAVCPDWSQCETPLCEGIKVLEAIRARSG